MTINIVVQTTLFNQSIDVYGKHKSLDTFLIIEVMTSDELNNPLLLIN